MAPLTRVLMPSWRSCTLVLVPARKPGSRLPLSCSGPVGVFERGLLLGTLGLSTFTTRHLDMVEVKVELGLVDPIRGSSVHVPSTCGSTFSAGSGIPDFDRVPLNASAVGASVSRWWPEGSSPD